MNKSFGINLELLTEAHELALSLKRGTIGTNCMYFETGQGGALFANAHHSVDQQTIEARSYAVAREFSPLLVNSVVGFIGPEYLLDGKQITRAGLEDHFCGKLLGLPMGCDVCYTNHSYADQNDMDNLLSLLALAGCNFTMAVPGADDVMLNYQSTSYHDAVTVRQLFNYRPGGHLKTVDTLNFQCGFVQAKDAVFSDFDALAVSKLCESLHLPYEHIVSQAPDLYQFLMRPDLGRLLPQDEVDKLQLLVQRNDGHQYQDVLIVISGGLSPLAIQNQIPGFFSVFIERINSMQISLAPIIINPRGRVALGDHLNAIFKAKVVVMLIGERPGLTIPDSMGIYVTHNAKPSCTDHMRQCISNIHQHGLGNASAVMKLLKLVGLHLGHIREYC